MFGYCNRAMLTGTLRSAAGGWEVGAGRGHCVSSRAVSTEWGKNVNYTQGRPAVAVRRALSFLRLRLRVFRTSCDRPLSCQMSDVRAFSYDRQLWHREGPSVAGGVAGAGRRALGRSGWRDRAAPRGKSFEMPRPRMRGVPVSDEVPVLNREF